MNRLRNFSNKIPIVPALSFLFLLSAQGMLFAQWQWHCAAANPFSVRRGHAMIEFENKLWVINGCNMNENRTDIWNSPDGKNWTRVTATVPYPLRAQLGAVVDKGTIWLLGGQTSC